MLARLLLFVFILFMLHVPQSSEAKSTRKVKLADFDKIRLDEKGYNKTRDIHFNWYIHSIKALMGQLGKDLLKKLNKGQKRDMLRCLNAIVDRRDIVSAGRCLVHAKDKLEEMQVQRLKYNEHMETRQNSKEASIPAFVQENATSNQVPTSAFVIDPVTSGAKKDSTQKQERKFEDQQTTAFVIASESAEQKKEQLKKYKNWKEAAKFSSTLPTEAAKSHETRSSKRIHIGLSKNSGPIERIAEDKSESTEVLEKQIQQRLRSFWRASKKADESTKRKLRRKLKQSQRQRFYLQKKKLSALPEMMEFRRVKRSPHRLIADHVQKRTADYFLTDLKSRTDNSFFEHSGFSKSVASVVKCAQDECAHFFEQNKTTGACRQAKIWDLARLKPNL